MIKPVDFNNLPLSEAEKIVHKKLLEKLQKNANEIANLQQENRILKYTAFGCCGLVISYAGYKTVPVALSVIAASKLGLAIINLLGTVFSSDTACAIFNAKSIKG